MSESSLVRVSTRDGLSGTIDTRTWPLDGSKDPVLAHFADGRRVLIPLSALKRQRDGSYWLDASLGAPMPGQVSEANQPLVIPVIQEEIQAGKRKVETGLVRITRNVVEREEVVDQPLSREEVVVEHVPVNRPVDAPLPVRQEGDTIVVPVVEEVLVVQKQLLLKEELRITRRRTERHDPQHVIVRRHDVKVERLESPSRDQGGTHLAPPA